MLTEFHTLIIYSQKEKNNALKGYLEQYHYHCDQVIEYHDLKQIRESYNVIIIEDQFPQLNTKDFIIRMKMINQPIVIAITDSMSRSNLDSILNSGADDYIQDPFENKDIITKIQSVYINGILKPRQIYYFKDIILNIANNTCICNNQILKLTKYEFKLLSILVQHPYQLFNATYLFEEIWGSSLYEDNTSLPALVKNLSYKLSEANHDVKYIKEFNRNQYKMVF